MKSFFTLLVVVAVAVSCQTLPTKVTICSAIHGAHKSNPNYSYDDLFAFIEEQNPDVIGVEIRHEDMTLPDSVLANYYPYEMREISKRFPNAKVLGFDWLGSEIEGQSIYPTYFEEMEITQLENRLGEDSALNNALKAMEDVRNAKIELVLNGSLFDLNGEVYDSLNTVYYDQMASIFANTPYSALTDFYRKRDEQITNNIIAIIRMHSGKRLLFIMGGDHRSYAMAEIRSRLGSELVLNDVFEKGP